jgi:hypothetical protein
MTAGHLPCRWQQSWRSVRRQISCQPPSRLRRRGQARHERPGLPASHSYCGPVSVRLAVRRCAGAPGMVSAGSQLSGPLCRSAVAQRSLTP